MRPLAGGTSNAMFEVDFGSARCVLRRPPKVAMERANEGMRREFRILAALEGSDVPHPAVIALCDDHDVLGCTFFLMERIDGVNPIPLPAGFDNDMQRAEIAFAMVEALANIHRIDWRAVGLGDLGRPERFHERQVARWRSQRESYGGRELPGIGDVMAWLETNRPVTFEPTLMHGDFHMRNALIAGGPPGRVVAVLDWETATIGDPLLDLAGFCEVWCPAADRGWPARQQLIDRYRTVRELDQLDDPTYYEVLYNFRIAVLMEGIHQRSLAVPARHDPYNLGHRVLENVGRAVELIDESRGKG